MDTIIMYLKKKRIVNMKKITLIIALIPVLASCDFFFDNGIVEHDIIKETYTNAEGDIPLEKVSGFKNYTKDTNINIGFNTLDTTGNQKVLVVPVVFEGENDFTDNDIDRLNKSFFGTEADTGWESVKTYYEESSSNRLSLSGEVGATLYLDVSTSFAIANVKNGNVSAVSQYAISDLYKSYSKKTLQDYDLNGDGYVDSVAFIYSNNYDYDEFWAYVDYTGEYPNEDKPTVCVYMWASYTFLNDSSLKIDTHTYIHEFGHILGLDDYYSYDQNGWDPSGSLEMQSHNVGDQGGYSKVTNGWNDVIYVNGKNSKSGDSINIEIDTTALKDGDLILINDKWNYSTLGEYILIEYYTPAGLNEYSASGVNEDYNIMYTESGLRIYHIDSRVCTIDVSNGFAEFVSYTDEIKNNDNQYYYFVGASNSVNRSYLSDENKGKFKLQQLMQANVTSKHDPNHFENGGMASNDTLYNVGDVFMASDTFFANETKFNSGNNVGYSVEMISKNTTSANVEITKL